MLFSAVILSALAVTKLVSAADVVISITDADEFGAYVNPNSKNVCEGEELEMLTICASEVLSKLDECKPDDLACECCALQSMKGDCHGLCPNTPSGNLLALLHDDCETMNDVNACNLPFKKHDAQLAKFLRPNARLPVEEKEPDFALQSVFVNSSNESVVVSHFERIYRNDYNQSNSTNSITLNSTDCDEVQNGSLSSYSNSISGFVQVIFVVCAFRLVDVLVF